MNEYMLLLLIIVVDLEALQQALRVLASMTIACSLSRTWRCG